MERGELYAAVARAIADNYWRVVDASDGHPSLVEDPERAAAAAIGVVLAEAQRIVREFPLNICGYGAPMPADHAASVEQFREAVLAALVPPPPV